MWEITEMGVEMKQRGEDASFFPSPLSSWIKSVRIPTKPQQTRGHYIHRFNYLKMLNKPLKIGRVHRIAKIVYGNLLNANRSYVNTYLMSKTKNQEVVIQNPKDIHTEWRLCGVKCILWKGQNTKYLFQEPFWDSRTLSTFWSEKSGSKCSYWAIVCW